MKSLFSYQNLHKKYHHLWYGRCVVLLYHRVINLEFDPQLLSVDMDNFEDHLKIIKNKFNCLTIDEFHQYLDSGKRIPQKSVVITFDDGYQDNNLYARPLLEKYNLEALFYISTGYLNNNIEFWWDDVERILFSGNISIKDQIKWDDFELNFTEWNDLKRDELYKNILTYLRNLSVNERNKHIEELRINFNLEKEGRISNLAMSYFDLINFASSKSVVIGAHTVNHPSLAHLSYEDQYYEIKNSVYTLKKCINKDVVDFSYPFGTISNYNLESIKICKELGLKYVAANFPKVVNKRTDKFQFPRFLVRNWKGEEFYNKINEYFKSDESFTY